MTNVEIKLGPQMVEQQPVRPVIRSMSIAERRARNKSLNNVLCTPPSYPGYSAYLGCISRIASTGEKTFQPYYGNTSNSSMTTSVSGHLRSISQVRGEDVEEHPRFTISPTPPLCSPEDDTEFQLNSESDVISKKSSSQNASSSSGYGSAGSDSDPDDQSLMSQSMVVEVKGRQRGRLGTRMDLEEEKWRRRSVPASLRHALPDDVLALYDSELALKCAQDVMELSTLRRPESVMQLARRFGEIAAAQQNDLHKSSRCLNLEGKENHTRQLQTKSGPSTPSRHARSAGDLKGGIASLRVASTMAARPNMFKQMDRVGSTTSNVPRNMNPNSIKDALLRWVQNRVKDYPVNVTNFSSSWADGTAFCALIHRFAPNAFDFNQIDARNRKANFELAFRVAEEHGICPLLEVEDMLLMGDRPDWKCVFTYVQCFYKHFKDRE